MSACSIRFTAAACQLAKVLYLARAQAYDLAVPAWEALHHTRKMFYVQQAEDILNANRPYDPDAPIRTGFVSVTRQPATVVGRIAPQGEPR